MATQTVFLSNPAGSNATYVGNPPDDNFVITDNGGNDTITLGNGTDQLTLGNGNNTATLGDGPDQITAGAGNNTLTIGNGNGNITVGNGNDTITVGTGSNMVALGSGLDTVSTGAGGNIVTVSAAGVSGDTIMGALTSGDGTTNKLVLTTAGTMSPVNVSGFQSYQLANGGANSLTLAEGNFARLPRGSISVGGGNSGNTINASVLSAAHAVVINAGAGIDSLTGGAGNDLFVFAPSNLAGDTADGGGGNNTLELQAGGPGVLSGLGTSFVNFSTIALDAGAAWTIGVSNAAAVSGTVTNFAAGDRFDFVHVAATASNYSGGILTLTNNGSVTASIAVSTPYSAPSFSLSSDSAGGTLVSVTAASTPPPPVQAATLDTMQPGDFANRGVNDTIWMGTDGSIRIYEITNGQVTAAPLVSQVGSDWSFGAVGHFFGYGAASDYTLQRSDGTIELYQVQNDQVIGAGRMAVVGSDWRAVATGDFYQVGSDSLLLNRPSDGAYELYDIRAGQVVGASQLAKIGTDWTFAGTGNFYNNGTLDFLAEQQGTGALEVWQVKNGQIVGAAQIGVVGGDEHVVGIADFNNDGVSDILMQSNSGTFRIYEIQNGQVVAAPVVAQIGTNWQPAGVGNFFGSGEAFLMRSGPNVEAYHIQNYQVTDASTLASVGSNIQIAGAYFNHPV